MTNDPQPTLEKVVIRKLIWRIVPFIMLLYFVAYLDRVNVGFAALTMNHDIGLSQAAFGFGAGIFFIGYFIFEVPSNLILHKVGARVWIARIMFTWGLISAAMVFVQGPISFYILRFLLGVAEAGFFPGIILYLSYWFPARHRAGVTAMFMAAVPISIALGSPLSGALLNMDGLMSLHGWQWMFLIEALPAIILAFVVLVYLTDKPADANWLSDQERQWLESKMNAENKTVDKEHGSIFRALADTRVLILALVYFGTSAGLYTLGIWAPQIIAQYGVGSVATGFINALPPVFAIGAMIFWARHSDQTGERNWHVFAACAVAALGLLLASAAASLVTVVLALILVNIGVSSAKPPLWSMPSSFLSGRDKAAGIAAINSIGNLGGFAGPTIIGVIKSYSGSYQWGLITVGIALLISAALVLVIRVRTKADQLLTGHGSVSSSGS
jgi:ACS family tartrate transporter-like MFS transporter